MAVKRAESNVKKASEKPKKQVNDVSLEDQLRLAEILNDTPHIVNLNGTKWEIRALRIGTQMLIAEVLSRFVDDGSENFGGVMKNIGKNIDAVVECITLGLLNDRMKIYDGGAKENGFSSLYHSTKETIRWDVDVSKLGGILVEMIQMIDISFFYESLAILDVVRQNILKKKAMRTKGQKQSIL